jgi:hypothetical protein
VWLEGLGILKKFSDLIKTQTHNLPACSIALEPCMLLCAHEVKNIRIFDMIKSTMKKNSSFSTEAVTGLPKN